ncbi:thioredoxin-like protein [Penicillium atrosanguineum]|nr:thioredoxin-like protein [Penicillium atrosanguineum]
MANPKITLYVDVISPFAYIAFHVLKASAYLRIPPKNRSNIDFQNSPTFAKACNNSPPINIKNKDKWINKERERWAKYFSVPMADKTPDGFPVRTLAVQRALCALSQKAPAKMPAVLEALYRAFWVERNSKIGEPEGFQPILESVLGKQDTEEILSAMGQPDVKGLLMSNTDRAFKEGAFGLPWVVCTDANGKTEGFWGVDHLGQVADFLGLDRRDAGFKALL